MIGQLIATSIGKSPHRQSLQEILQKVTDLPDLHTLNVWYSQPVVWRHHWNFRNLLCLEINGLGCEQETLNLPSFPALLDLKMSFGEENEFPCPTDFHVYVDFSRLPNLSSLDIEGVIDEDISDGLTFCGVTKSLQKFTAKRMRYWPFWNNWKCMNESLEEIRLQCLNDNKSFPGPTELYFPRLKILELENSMNCLPLDIGLPVLNQINLKLGPGDFGYLSCHLSSPISVLHRLPITLNLRPDGDFFDSDWQTCLDSRELKTLAQLISRSNVRLGEDEKTILEMLSA